MVAGAWLAALALAFLVPVYSDEVGWRLQERGGLDGLDKLYSEQCGPNTLARPLWFMWPVRWYSAFFNTLLPDPFWVRASGVAYALLWAGLLLALLMRVAGNRAPAIIVLCVGLMGLGTEPLQLAWSRPEQPIVLAATGALLLAWGGYRQGGWWRGPAILALTTVALSYHFKALVLVPLWLVCLFFSDRPGRPWAARLIMAAALVGLAAQAGGHWYTRLSCPGDNVLATQHAAQSLHFAPGTGLPARVATVIGNFAMPAYVSRAAPDATPMASWLPAGLVSHHQQTGWRIAMTALWAIALLLALAAIASALRQRGRAALADPRLGFAVMLFGTASVYCVGQVVRNAYEATFVLPLLAMGCGCALAIAPEATLPRLRIVSTITGLAMLASMALVGAIYGPSLVRATSASGYLAQQPLSVPVFHYAAARATITRAGALCGLSPDNTRQRLLLDDATYFTFMRTTLPDHHLSVLDPQWSGKVTDPLAYLKAQGMDGAVVACRFLSPQLRQKARAFGGVCCLSRANW